MSLMQLRDYQRAAVDAVFDYASKYDGHALVVLPTGAGKSLVMGTIAAEALANDPGARALVLAHRKELIEQNYRAVLTAMPLGRVGVYSASVGRKDTDHSVIVGGIQSLAKKPHALGAFDVVLVDEAHLIPPDDDTMYRKVIGALRIQNPGVRFVGLTATPFRLKGGRLDRGENALFTDVVYEARVADLIAQGYLCRLVSRGTREKLNTAGVATRGGEYVPGELARAVDTDDTNAAVAVEILRLAEGRTRILVFCAGVEHAEHMAARLAEHGVPSAAVHGELSMDERAAHLAAFKAGRVRALTNCDVLTTGFDEPGIDCIALLRPTKSAGLYVQMVGRGFRLSAEKSDTLVLDFAGNVARFGPVDCIDVADVKAPGEGAAPTKECPACAAIVYAGVRACPECGFAFPPPERPPILPVASGAPVLSTEVTWEDVEHVMYHHHVKKNADPDSVPTLRVEYYTGSWRRIVSEWVCVEHPAGGFARTKAEGWWARRADTPCPTSVSDALERQHELDAPLRIATQPDPSNPKYTRIADVAFAPRREAGLPRACWSCGAWSDTWKHCILANAVPPADVQAVGCELWTEDDLALLPF